jgi:hypothetical protein
MAQRRRAPLTLEEERRLREALRNRVPHKDIARRFNITSRKIQEIAAQEKLNEKPRIISRWVARHDESK